MSSAQKYLARVLPWPLDGAGGFVNVHAKPNDGQHKGWVGRGCKTVDEAISYINWLKTLPHKYDIYACQSQQKDGIELKTKTGRTYFKAVRNQENALFLKSIFLDVDFKHYGTPEATRAALRDFTLKSGLPPASAVVKSTGGFHVYWTMMNYLTPAEWWPLAHALVNATKDLGFKVDTQSTIDSARVLRIPDTLNYKRNQLVELGYVLDFDYTLDRIEKALLPWKVSTASAVHHVNGYVADLSLFPPLTPLDYSPLSAGIEFHSNAPKLTELTKECEFLREAVNTGGANYDNPLWFLTTSIATFLEDGRAAAHAMGNKHKDYKLEETDKEYDRLLKDRKEKNTGWVKCGTISGYGCTFCKACKHLPEGKSPLNFRETINLPPPQDDTHDDGGGGMAPPGVTSTNVLPDGYRRNAKGLIEKQVEGDDGTSGWVIVCDTPIANGWLQRAPWGLNFFAETEPNKTEQIHLPFEVIGAVNELRKELSRQGVTVLDKNIKLVEEFLLSWISKLKKTKDAIVNTSPFGWNVSNGKVEGFVYGGKLYTPTDVRAAQSPDVASARSYTPVGDIQPWINAAKLITDQKRPALDAIVASSFGAPLVRFTDMLGLMMNCVGESGIGKSTAVDVGLTVWGHRVKAKNVLVDTDNSVMNKIGELRSLPIFWDDLQPEATRRYGRMTFQVTYGKEKDRLNQNAKRREAGTWQTLMISTSNNSLLDFLTENSNATTTAGIYRLFEIKVDRNHGLGQIAKADAARLIGKLTDNYGRVGEAYAEYLGANFEALEEEVLEFQKALDVEVDASNEERLWTCTITCVCIGARVANRLGFTEFDEDALREFMIATLRKMRTELKDRGVDMTDKLNVSSILSSFLNQYRQRNTLFTNIIHKGQGRPSPGSIKIVGDTSRLDAIYVHIGLEDKMMRINSTAMGDWLKSKDISRHAFTSALKEQYGMRVIHAIIGGGTALAVPGIAYLLELNLTDFTELDPKQLFDKTQAEVTSESKSVEGVV